MGLVLGVGGAVRRPNERLSTSWGKTGKQRHEKTVPAPPAYRSGAVAGLSFCGGDLSTDSDDERASLSWNQGPGPRRWWSVVKAWEGLQIGQLGIIHSAMEAAAWSLLFETGMHLDKMRIFRGPRMLSSKHS